MEKFEESLKDKIYSIRGHQVMLDRDLAELYGVETKVLNQAVKRNKERFPSKFCFSLNSKEMQNLKSQFVTSSWDGRRYDWFVFTEHGVTLLASVLNSKTAIDISIKIIDAFIEMRKFIQSNAQVFQRLDNVEVEAVEMLSRLGKLK
ncbi:MAG: ORF6N domain-containing protein [Candidatus Delongbacteria bacterium]